MVKKDPRIDAYIKKSAPFAQPILTHLRQLVHKTCPDAEETIKWGFPHFDYKGILCSMAAFKQHCSFGFWKASLMKNAEGKIAVAEKHSMGHLGKLTSIKDLPSDKIMVSYIREAMMLNETETKLPAKSKAPAKKTVLKTPAILQTALDKNKKAKTIFDAFSPSQQKEYIVWITEAKTEATKLRRLEQAIEWMEEGKVRMWKYAK
jgi:uncharacterized protein YdeI (YjbR/CyaY-like superfamily)